MHSSHSQQTGHYWHLALMAALSFGAMYALMYAMVNSAQNVLPNLNQLYMAGLMAAAMIVIELVAMRQMYPIARWNAAIVAVSLAGLVGFFVLIRGQVAIGNNEFLRSMIPHHGAAILMCQQASVQDPEIIALCGEIVSGQQAEIDQMRAILERLGR